MTQSLTELSKVLAKTLILAFFLTFLSSALLAEQQEEAEQPNGEQAESQEQDAPQELDERQKRLIESLGVSYEEGESFDEIMLRARRMHLESRRAGQDTDVEAPQDGFEARMSPEMLEQRQQQAQRIREQHELLGEDEEVSPQPQDAPQETEEIEVAAQEVPQQPEEVDLEQDDTEAAEQPQESISLEELLKDFPIEEAKAPEKTDQRGATDGNEELELTITLPERVEITALIELVGKQLGLNYIYDPSEIQGDIMLKVHDGRIKVKDTYALLESVLKFRGFVMSRRGNLITIVPEGRATEIDPKLIEEGDVAQPGDVIVTNIFRLEYISTDVAKDLLTNMRLTTSIVTLPETRSVIVTGYAYRMDRIRQMLSLVDLPGEKREFDFRRLDYTIASNIVGKIQALAENLGTVDITVAARTSQDGRPAPRQPVRRDAQGRIIPQPAQPQQDQEGRTAEISSQELKSGIYLDVDDRTNRIFMIGSKGDIEEVNKLIDTFDVPKHDVREIKEYKPEFADASDIIFALQELGVIEDRSNQARTAQARTVQQRQGEQDPRQAPAVYDLDSLEDAPQVVYMQSTNTLLVNATDEQHERITYIMMLVDRQPDREMAPVQVYPLINQSLEDIVDTLTNVIERVARDKAEAEGTAGSTEGKVQTAHTGSTPQVTVAGDKGTNSVVVYASNKDQEWIAKLIDDLDKKRPHVLIDVTLVEIRQSDKFEYDLKQAASKSLGDTSGAIGAPMQGADLGNYLDGAWGEGTFRGFYSDSHIQALLTLVEDKNYGRIMAKPKLLVNDNQEGTIETTTTTYRPITRIDYVRTGTETTQPVETTSWESYEAGVNLAIKPHISEGELLRLEISINRTDFDFASSTPGSERPYDTITSTVDTIVTVPDKSTIILGGLITINQGKAGSKIPVLGDLPLVGGLFRSISNSSDQSKLYLFVKADILRPDEVLPGLPQLEKESDIHREAFEKWEREFQERRDWPGFDAEPMEPERVLEMK